jgi:hypothetical protein
MRRLLNLSSADIRRHPAAQSAVVKQTIASRAIDKTPITFRHAPASPSATCRNPATAGAAAAATSFGITVPVVIVHGKKCDTHTA